MTATLIDEVAELRRANAELQQRLDEALARESATAEVLGVINSSTGNLQPVFDAMLGKAVRLCGGTFGMLSLYDGDGFRGVAAEGVSREISDNLSRLHHPPAGTGLHRLQQTLATVQIADCAAEPAYDQVRAANPPFVTVRTALHVPMLKERDLLGAILIYRDQVLPFTENEVELVESFAKQAAIAIENARLITETREALERQTATAEVLGVINSSPGDLAPVFDAMLEKATRLCDAFQGVLWLIDGERVRIAATYQMIPQFIEVLRRIERGELPPLPPLRQIMEGECFLISIPNIAEHALYPNSHPAVRAAFEIGQVRSVIWVGLVKEGAAVGAFGIARREVRPFSDAQIALLQNFAAQAVVAIENTRLINETREALDQQTATAEVLGVINSSPGDLAPVFNAMLDKALRLCDANFGQLITFDGIGFRAAAWQGYQPEPNRSVTTPPTPGMALYRIIHDEEVVHVSDITADEVYRSGNPTRRRLADEFGARTAIWVALKKDAVLLGAFVIYRTEVRPFTDKQIALLQNFAAQAVIAMENARLITETREALDQQTATAEVLQVINASPGDLTPVFDAMLDKALRLCGASYGGLQTYDGEVFHPVAERHDARSLGLVSTMGPIRPQPGTTMERIVRGESLVHVTDLKEDEGYRSGSSIRRALVDVAGARSIVSIALRRDEALLGALHVYRPEVGPFSDKQIALLQNFAAQAVIAMENARLITETREALEQQTATAEVLQVINSSPGDLLPVFDEILEKAHALCGASRGTLFLFDGEAFRAAASHGYSEVLPERARTIAVSEDPRLTVLLAGAELIHVPDLTLLDDPVARAVAGRGGVRTNLLLPLRKDGTLLGVLSCNRSEVRPFSDRQIALLQNFAAQAVIAMENARLITETREALDQQTATSEVLAVINSSPGDLKPVFDTMLEKAMRLCEANLGFLSTFDGQHFDAVATYGVPEAYAAEYFAKPYMPAPGTTHARIVNGEDVVHVTDLIAEGLDSPRRRAVIEMLDARTILGVALRKDGALLGALHVYRQEVRPFSEKQIALLQNFAAQAVIAIENTRLITETRDALDQQTATAEVLQVINSSPGDLAPVFEAMLEKAMRLCEAAFGSLWTNSGDRFHPIAHHGVPAPYAEYLAREVPAAGAGTGRARLLAGEPFAHIADLADEEPYRAGEPHRRALVDLGGARSALLVPLRKDEAVIGFIMIYRQEVRPFSAKQIALLENFAAQAVIAMENTRLITETREALEQQTATAEVLQVINSSPGDLMPVFDAILEKAHSLCGAAKGALTTYDGEYFRSVATRGVSGEYAAMLRASHHNSRGSPPQRLLNGESLVHVPDMSVLPFPMTTAAAELEGARTALYVPLRKDGALLGYLTAFRHEVRPFTDKQIALLENFAAQAVIAIENARLITETREALEQQTATAEVLQVINSSPGELAPVFEAMLERAMRLCEAGFGELDVYDGQQYCVAATLGVPAAFDEYRRNNPSVPRPGSFGGRLVAGETVIHIVDLANDQLYLAGNSNRRAIVELGGARTVLVAPLRKDEAILGFIILYRQEIRGFSAQQIALLQSFAAQAVIAMENARLINETREALEQQTATAEVLGVINSSPGDLGPVFDAILEKAHVLCGAAHGSLTLYDGELFHAVATHGQSETFASVLRRPRPASPVHQRLQAGERFVQIADIKTLTVSPSDIVTPAAVEAGIRTQLFVPLRKDGLLLGYITAHRREVRPFSEKEIALLENFAAQAVIAIENARLIAETKEALDQQTATAEVLGVINSSPGDLAPVFDAMLEKAMWLCGAAFGELQTYNGERFEMAALRGLPPVYAEFRMSRTHVYGPGTIPARLLAGERLVQVLDITAEDAYRDREPNRLALADLGGARTVLAVPLLKDDALLGFIVVYRQEVRQFSDKQIALLQNFAAQAVIAIENARLITETREALEQQQAIAEMLQVINRSPGDLQPVFDILLDKAMRLCEAAFGLLHVKEGDQTQTVAAQGVPPALAEWRRNHPVISTQNTLLARVLAGEPYIHTLDLKDDDLYRRGEPLRCASVDLGGARTSLYVPLKRDRDVLGTIHIYRQEVRPFSDKQVALLKNFAAQAVIAMENARLLEEIRQRQAELRVTFDNMADGVVMFDEDLRLAAWNRNFQELLDLPDAVLTDRPSYADYLRTLAERGEFGTEDIEGELNRRLEDTDQEFRLERTRPDGRVIEVRRNSVPDGGFVLIYSDITERKRSEAEIRAARDAAESAYRDLKAAQANLVQAEKMASLGQLTAGIAHEIKNPLNFVNNFASLSVELLDELKETAAPALATLDADKRADVGDTMELLTGNLEKIAEHGKRADNIVKSMLEHSRGVSGERREVDLNQLVEEALNLAYHGARAQDQTFNITLERDYGAGLKPIEVAPQEITRVFLNLFGNGFYAANKRSHEKGDDGSFRPSLTAATRDTGDAVEVRVRDNGTGIPPEIKDKLFQPFFTTKPTGEGTGLGLSISYDIVTQQHGGTITVDSRVGEFTEFTVRLPRTHRASAEAAS